MMVDGVWINGNGMDSVWQVVTMSSDFTSMSHHCFIELADLDSQ
jgi:hypothetical protein